MKKITALDKHKLIIFKRILSEKLPNFSATDEELIILLNSAVLPNAIDKRNLDYSIFFFPFFNKKYNIEDLKTKLNRLFTVAESFSRIEKKVYKFAILKGFSSKYYKKELFRYIREPYTKPQGRKIISSTKFKEIFSFAYKIIKKAENNDLAPRV